MESKALFSAVMVPTPFSALRRLPLLALAGLALAAGGDAVRAGPPMTWEDCLRYCASNDPGIRAAQASVDKASEDWLAARGAHWPQISASGGASRSGSESDGVSSTATGYQLGLSAQQDLFTGFRNQAQAERSRALMIAAEQSLLRVKADRNYALKSAFNRLLFAQEYGLLSATIASRRQENVNLVELRFEAGREHKGSLLRSRAYKHQADYEKAQAARDIVVVRRELATALGGAKADGLAITGEWTIIPPPPAPPDFAGLVASIPDHQQALEQVRAARESVRVADSSFYPQWTVSASAQRQSDTLPPQNDQWSLSTSVSFPLFSGGQDLHAVRGARAERRRAEASLDNTDIQLAYSLEDLFRVWLDATERVGVMEEFLQAAEVRAEIARSQYSNGLITFDDWDLIENDLIDKQRQVLASRRDAVLAQAAWEKVCGTSALP